MKVWFSLSIHKELHAHPENLAKLVNEVAPKLNGRYCHIENAMREASANGYTPQSLG